jgi:ParB family transcriptional regulator, chromosome partitioning protein
MGRLNDLGHGRLDTPKLDPRDVIIRKGWNYRDVESPAVQAHIDWLKESIRERGVQKPIEVEYVDGKVYLVDGECRLRAAQALWKEKVEVYIPAMQVKGDEAEIRAKSMIANGALPPTQLEFGKAAAQLRAYGWTDERIGDFTPPHIAINKKRATKYVKDAVDLHEAPLEVKDIVAHGVDGVKVSPALALAATKKNRLQAAEILKEDAGKAKAKGKTVATRPKGAGKATKAKAAKEAATVDLFTLGDRLAAQVLETGQTGNWDKPERLARQWQKARG